MADDEYIYYMLKQWSAGNLYVHEGQFYDMETNEPTGLYISESPPFDKVMEAWKSRRENNA